mmetsp:Transcript_24174/g.39359  ORF Transcript_24174/g.39359 Transcript_24174/m.39359 type:complete len:151 (-) Transcript_24174:1731-2183(-)
MSMPTKQLPANDATLSKATLSPTSTPLAHRLVFGALSGMGAATFCHPLDVIRVQMQTDGVAYKNTFDAATKIYQRAGILEGLYVRKSNSYASYFVQYSIILSHIFILTIIGGSFCGISSTMDVRFVSNWYLCISLGADTIAKCCQGQKQE